MAEIRVDFHIHSCRSPDSIITFDDLVSSCHKKRVSAVAIMDHDVIDGAIDFTARAEELRSGGRWAPRIIIGEEVRTSKGEICGLFLSEWIPPGRSPHETMKLIRDQGGLVYIPHPFDLLKFKRLKATELAALSNMIDIVEVFNGKPRFPWANRLARRFLDRHPFPAAAGSDAHESSHLGAVVVEMEEFSGPDDLLEKLSRSRISGTMYCPFTSAYIRMRERRRRST